MIEENWQKVREIFDAAVRRKPEERQSYIRELCGEDKFLLSEVESLLVSFDSAESFLETPAIAKVADAFEGETRFLENGTCFGHYEITRQIGMGGMGEVYLAKDGKLDRQVAIKILNKKFSREESNLNRFIREAKTASALDHPNILVIHEIGEAENTHYIVSEFIKGQTLRDVLKEKSLNLSEILDISIQIANALSAAHEAHLVHRDIKPENIMVRPDGFIKVLDFGLAKLVGFGKADLGLGIGDDDKNLIESNEYNSKSPIPNSKSQLTSAGMILGTVNYMSPEQAKGERVDERTDIFSFGVVIYEMLAGRTPFAGDSGLETIANLIHLEPPVLSQFLTNVPTNLERAVLKMLRKKPDERYPTMKDLLVDLKNFRHNPSFEEKPERTAAVTTEVLIFKQNNSETGDIQAKVSEPANAYQAYQLARYHFQQLSPTDLIRSRALLEEAVQFDADFAPAHAALAEQWVLEGITGLKTPAETFPKAKESLRRVAELNPTSTEFYAAAGLIDLICDWNFKQAERNLRKALRLNSHYAFANNYLGQVFMFRCLPDQAETYLRRAVEIQPMGLYNCIMLTIGYFLGRRFQKSIEECEKMLAVYPGFIIAGWMRCWTLEQTGRAAEAVVEYKKILLEPNGELARRWIGFAYALVGDRENALETAARLIADSRRSYISPTHLAALYAGLNEADQAFFYLDKGLELRDPWMLWIAADPRFDNLRGDSHFDELVRRVGLK